MLALMNLLEKEGPVFSDRLLVTIRGALRCALPRCAALCCGHAVLRLRRV